MTVHKAQGQTFNNVHVALQGYFAHGLFYVAISRARSLTGLTLDRSMNLNLMEVQKALTRHHLVQSFFDTNFPGIYGPAPSQRKRKLDEFDK
jgi:superfamily I DNA/RNA helicase